MNDCWISWNDHYRNLTEYCSRPVSPVLPFVTLPTQNNVPVCCTWQSWYNEKSSWLWRLLTLVNCLARSCTHRKINKSNLRDCCSWILSYLRAFGQGDNSSTHPQHWRSSAAPLRLGSHCPLPVRSDTRNMETASIHESINMKADSRLFAKWALISHKTIGSSYLLC